MRSLIVRSPWSVVRSRIILGAIVTGWLVMMNSSLGQEAPAPTQDNKPATSSEKKPASDSSGGHAPNMAEKMMGAMGGKMGGATRPAEPTLEEMLNQALKDNPDIRVAEAKVREAEAELNRTRLQVTQKVLAFHHSRESQKAFVKSLEEDVQRFQKMKQTNDVSVAEANLSAAKVRLVEIEAEMPYLLGQQHGMKVSSMTSSPDGKPVLSADREWATLKLLDPTTGQETNTLAIDLNRPVTIRDAKTGQAISFSLEHPAMVNAPTHSTPQAATVTEKLRKALDTPMTVDYQDKPIAEIFKEMEKRVPGLSIQVQIPAPNEDEDYFRRLTLKGQFSMRAVLALMEDTFSVRMNPEPQTRYTFAVREYGLLFAPNNRIPREAIRLHDLQKEIPPPKEEKKQDMQRK